LTWKLVVFEICLPYKPNKLMYLGISQLIPVLYHVLHGDIP